MPRAWLVLQNITLYHPQYAASPDSVVNAAELLTRIHSPGDQIVIGVRLVLTITQKTVQ